MDRPYDSVDVVNVRRVRRVRVGELGPAPAPEIEADRPETPAEGVEHKVPDVGGGRPARQPVQQENGRGVPRQRGARRDVVDPVQRNTLPASVPPHRE